MSQIPDVVVELMAVEAICEGRLICGLSAEHAATLARVARTAREEIERLRTVALPIPAGRREEVVLAAVVMLDRAEAGIRR